MGSLPLPEFLFNRKKLREEKKTQFSSWQPAAQTSRCSGHFQVALQLPHCGFVQRAQVKVKGSVCDVKVSSFFNEVYNLQKYKQKIRIKSIQHFMVQRLYSFVGQTGS